MRLLRVALMAVVLACAAGRGGRAQAQLTQPGVPLTAGCTSVPLTFPAGTSLQTVAANIQPASALQGVFRLDPVTERYLAFSPAAPVTANNFTTVLTPAQPVFVCLSAPATFFGILPLNLQAFVAPVVTQGLLSAPLTVARGETIEISIATGPSYGCVGGINIPIPGGVRLERVEMGAAPSGIAVARIQTQTTDRAGLAEFAVRCGDGVYVRANVQIT